MSFPGAEGGPRPPIPDAARGRFSLSDKDVRVLRMGREQRAGGDPRYQIIRELVVPSSQHRYVRRGDFDIELAPIKVVAANYGGEWHVTAQPHDPQRDPQETVPIIGRMVCKPGTTRADVLDVVGDWVSNSTLYVDSSHELLMAEPGIEDYATTSLFYVKTC
jgi:hypothetical protein